MPTTYTLPDNPSDPEAAALDLIVRLLPDVLGHKYPAREVLQEFAALLAGEGAFNRYDVA